jgi:hypothetical protein
MRSRVGQVAYRDQAMACRLRRPHDRAASGSNERCQIELAKTARVWLLCAVHVPWRNRSHRDGNESAQDQQREDGTQASLQHTASSYCPHYK